MISDISSDVILFDWVTCSSQDEDPYCWVRLLHMDSCNWDEMDHGRNGYRKGLYFGSITILYDGNPGMGTCLDMSGQGCRTFETYGLGDFYALFGVFQSCSGYHMSRLDVAFDDHSGILDIARLFSDTDEQLYVSKFRTASITKEFVDGRPGITVYHGSRRSDILIRIYDKAAERGLSEDQHWVRVELQLRDQRASAFAFAADPIGELFRGVLYNYLRYVVLSDDSNRRRWPMQPYWEDLLAGVARIRLYTRPGVEYNIRQLDTFVFEQAANAVSAAMQIYGVPFVVDRLKSRDLGATKYKRLLDQYKSERGG